MFDNIHSWLAPFLQQFISSEKLQMQTDRLWLVSPGVVEWQLWWDGPAGPVWTAPSHPAGCWPSLQQGTGRHWCWKRRGGTKSEGVTHHRTPSTTTSTPPTLVYCPGVQSGDICLSGRRALPAIMPWLSGLERMWGGYESVHSETECDVQLKHKHKVCIPEDCLNEIWHTVVLHYWVGGWGGGVNWSQWSQCPAVSLDPQFHFVDPSHGVVPVQKKL